MRQSNIHEGSAKSYRGLEALFQMSIGLIDTLQRFDCTEGGGNVGCEA